MSAPNPEHVEIIRNTKLRLAGVSVADHHGFVATYIKGRLITVSEIALLITAGEFADAKTLTVTMVQDITKAMKGAPAEEWSILLDAFHRLADMFETSLRTSEMPDSVRSDIHGTIAKLRTPKPDTIDLARFMLGFILTEETPADLLVHTILDGISKVLTFWVISAEHPNVDQLKDILTELKKNIYVHDDSPIGVFITTVIDTLFKVVCELYV
jgi:hypothetical protein|uniref:Uncharacterized protein n=1 Tax=viral metagenome TaxID=1070528 RepID=A0A6C0IVR2_9ZZZZ